MCSILYRIFVLKHVHQIRNIALSFRSGSKHMVRMKVFLSINESTQKTNKARISYMTSQIKSVLSVNKSTACGCQRSTEVAFRKFLVEKGHNFVKKMEDYLPYQYGFPFLSRLRSRSETYVLLFWCCRRRKLLSSFCVKVHFLKNYQS